MESVRAVVLKAIIVIALMVAPHGPSRDESERFARRCLMAHIHKYLRSIFLHLTLAMVVVDDWALSDTANLADNDRAIFSACGHSIADRLSGATT